MELVGQQQQQQQLASSSEAAPATSNPDSSTPVIQMESLAKLESEVGVEFRTPSEVSNVELVKGKDGSFWLLSSQPKVVGKHVVLGGYGTGQWCAASECTDPSVPFQVDLGDKTIVQIDESSFGPDGAQGVSTLTLYKLLLRAETERQIVQHKFSFLTIERKELLRMARTLSTSPCARTWSSSVWGMQGLGRLKDFLARISSTNSWVPCLPLCWPQWGFVLRELVRTLRFKDHTSSQNNRWLWRKTSHKNWLKLVGAGIFWWQFWWEIAEMKTHTDTQC